MGEERYESNDAGNAPVYGHFCILRDSRQTGRIVWRCTVVTEFGPLARRRGTFQPPR